MSDEIPPLIEGSHPRIVAVVMIHDQIIAEGTASSSKYAKLKASQNALDLLSGLAPFEYRTLYRCNCSDPKEDGVVTHKQPVSLEDLVGSAI